MKPVFRIVGVSLLFVALALPAAQQSRKQTEADLKKLQDRVERLQRQVQQDSVEKDRLARDLRDAERSVSGARGSLRELRAKRAERTAAREKLAAEREKREAERQKTEKSLEAQIRAAYFMGRNEPLKLLLNQRNPGEVSRNLAYYGYFGRQRADQIALLNENIAAIEEVTARIASEDAELAELEGQQKKRVSELESARKQRGMVLASLEKQSRSRATQLAADRKSKEQLEQLLRRLEQAVESVPYDPNAPFAQLRGKLAWPVAGRIGVNYGALLAGGLRSTGVEIEADRGTDVRAVHEGRVLYADWLPGRGLLIILDHGNGYYSLYGHSEQLFRQAGTRVKAGETIATVGDTGGRKEPGLYFEIRRAGKPVDPRGWFRSSVPPTG